jgi:tRNA dimethylallyltransferase
VLIGLDVATPELDDRVDARVDRMFAAGLTEEVRELERRGLREGRTASRALGYQQVLAAFDGDHDLAAAAEQTARATRRFVRRQRSWFRRDARITWLDGARADLADAALRLARP